MQRNPTYGTDSKHKATGQYDDGWQPIERWDEETYTDRWVSFTDGQAVATRLIYPPMVMGFALSFSPTHFQVVELPRSHAELEAPTIDHAKPAAGAV